jgi:hypothetical protein
MKENYNRSQSYSSYVISIWFTHSTTAGSKMSVPLNHQALEAFLAEFQPTVKQWCTANVRLVRFLVSHGSGYEDGELSL